MASEIDQRVLAEDLLVVSGKSLNPEAWVGLLSYTRFSKMGRRINQLLLESRPRSGFTCSACLGNVRAGPLEILFPLTNVCQGLKRETDSFLPHPLSIPPDSVCQLYLNLCTGPCTLSPACSLFLGCIISLVASGLLVPLQRPCSTMCTWSPSSEVFL